MAFDWDYRKSCCSFTLYEKVGMVLTTIQMLECIILTGINPLVGAIAWIVWFVVLCKETGWKEKRELERYKKIKIKTLVE